jgi:hypothetical protein
MSKNSKPVQAYDGIGDVVGFVPPRIIDAVKPAEPTTPPPKVEGKAPDDRRYPNF